MVIDFHAHVFEEGQAGRVLADMGERASLPSFTDGTLAGLRRSMDDAGVDLSVISRITTRPSQVGPVNAWLEDLQGPRTLPLCTMHPDVTGIAEQVAGLRARGFPGFKMHPDYQGFFVDDERMFPFYEAVAASGMWILFHAGLDRGLPGHPVHATPARLLRVHRAFPRLRIIAAHLGGEDNYEETEKRLLGRDIYLDTSFVLRKIPVRTLERFLRKHPTERVLFGSDTPWSDQKLDLDFLRGLPFLSGGDVDRITGRNAAELLGLGTTTTVARASPLSRGEFCFTP
jgi:predicted TIM-barrel fold metal-dependent hydrolase